MGALTETQLWTQRLLFALTLLAVIFIATLPLGLTADAPVMPDLAFGLIFAWMIRRPEVLPLPIVAIAALFADALLMRPIGLTAFVVILTSEYLRAAHRSFRDQMFLREWLSFALFFIMGQVFQSAALGLTFAHVPTLGTQVVFAIVTILAYPAITGLLHYVYKVRPPRPVVDGRFGAPI